LPQCSHFLERARANNVQGGGSIFKFSNGNDAEDNVDPREAILKYADAAKKDPYWVAPAYAKTQPKAVLADSVIEDDEIARVIDNEDRQRAKRRRM
jgi:hypothetical protein